MPEPSNNALYIPIILLLFDIGIVICHNLWWKDYVRSFRGGSNFWFSCGYLLSIVLLVISIGVLFYKERTYVLVLCSTFSVLVSCSIFLIQKYISSVEYLATYAAKTYQFDRDGGAWERSKDVRDDLFDPKIGPLILQNESHLSLIVQHLSTHKNNAYYPKDMKDHRLAWILLAHLRHQKIPPSQWLYRQDGRALGANLLVAEFRSTATEIADQFLNGKEPEWVWRHRVWKEIPSWFSENISTNPIGFRRAGILHTEEISTITKYLIDHTEESSLLELEAAMLSLISIPQDLSSEEFIRFVSILADKKELFRHNIEDLLVLRTQIREHFPDKKELGFQVQSHGDNHELYCTEEIFSRLLISFGFIPKKGSDIIFTCSCSIDMLRKGGSSYSGRKRVETKTVQEERDWTNDDMMEIKTKTKYEVRYQERHSSIADGPIFRKDLKIGWKKPDTEIIFHSMETTVLLDFQYWKPGEAFFHTKPPRRGAHWLYTVPFDF